MAFSDDIFAKAIASLEESAPTIDTPDAAATGDSEQAGDGQETGTEQGAGESQEQATGDAAGVEQEAGGEQAAGEPGEQESEFTGELADDTEVTYGGKTGKHSDLFVPREVFTQKTQEWSAKVAEAEAKATTLETEVQGWFAERTKNRAAWAAEIAAESEDPTSLVAKQIVFLRDAGLLDPAFVKHFGLDVADNPVNQLSATADKDDRLAKVEAELEASRKAAEDEAAKRQLFATYEAQLNQIVTDNQLTFADAAEIQAFRVELLRFAQETGLVEDKDGNPDLTLAYEVMAARKGRTAPAAPAQPAAPAVKRAPKQVASGRTGAGAPPAPQMAKNSNDAFAAAMARMAANGITAG